jgi:hypothetical protein
VLSLARSPAVLWLCVSIMKFALVSLALVAVCASTEDNVYIGCYKDSSPRALPTFFCSNGKDPRYSYDCAPDPASPSGSGYAGSTVMAPQVCSALCAEHKFFALSNIGSSLGLCFCGSDYGRYGKAPEADCNVNCPNSSVICGGAWRLSVYAHNIYAHNETESGVSMGARV